jgi:hypothetical protein
MMKTCIVILGFALLSFCSFSQAATESEINERNSMIVSNHLGRVSLAYRSAVTQMMLGEANYFAKKLNLPTPHPIRITDIKDCHPSSAAFSIEGGKMTSLSDKKHPPRFVVYGNLSTTNFTFYFREGHLWSLGWAADSGMSYDEQASSLIDTNGAYQLAKHWLAAVDIDVGALEQKFKPNVEQRWYIRPGTETGDTNITSVPVTAPGQVDYARIPETNKVMLPTFEVSWSDAAKVKVLGTRKELMEFHLDDLSFSRRPTLVITNAIELSRTPDPAMNHPK